MGEYRPRNRIRLEGVPWGVTMTPSEVATVSVLSAVVSREIVGRVSLTRDQCRDICRIYEADPLYLSFTFPPEVSVAVTNYSGRRRNTQMNALLITYLLRASEGMVILEVGRRMALGLLAMFDVEVRERALKLADKWRKERSKR